jgi:hypothetical protein
MMIKKIKNKERNTNGKAQGVMLKLGSFRVFETRIAVHTATQ